ncbi:Coatomer subunit epsilon-2 [Wickerhamomyces ciferrii]|uniref:Coatomer subunit epsilon n=1 Tax=Wickerhamomyces ciferrii (strain ATCC 14091 / BCRC 22168 / CBS 111 / JCM 3599 / NBRC 0793 / NRRL Y-1031 F-60-10) TaxID=1206466 RepID=K0KK94_WICCF|nr:Coatomer subunit epsilon-2 [Wickerhamomyces ciferrii]CCH43361.1 Coatomer subunit epsilon-2 [Wickerhamomyces ciferrii]
MDSDELFNLRQQFFTAQYEKVSEINIEEYFDESQTIAREYKLRSLLALNKHSEVLSEVSSGSDEFSKAFTLYTKHLKGDSSIEEEFNQLISESGKSNWIVQLLGSFYLVSQEKFDEAINLLQRHEQQLEAVLLLTQLFIHQNKLESAEKEISIASKYANDSIIFNLAEAYLNSIKNGDSLRGSLYFFEELSHTNPSYKALIGQLVLNLQLHQFPEADEVFRQLKELGIVKSDLIANEIAYASITGDNETVVSKRAELEALEPNHPFVTDLKAKNELFDSIVEKYSEQIVN